MLTDALFAVKTTASTPLEDFVFSAATAQTSGLFDLRAAGYADGGGELFLHVNRRSTYTVGALTNLRVSIQTAAAASSDPIVYNSTLTSPVDATSIDVPVATINGSSEICKIALPPGLKRYIAVTITPTGAPTTITVNARITTS